MSHRRFLAAVACTAIALTTVLQTVPARAQDATASVLAERAERAETEVRGAAGRAAERARRLHEEAAQRAEQRLRRATSYLDSNPLAFAGLAFVAGVLLSTLVRR